MNFLYDVTVHGVAVEQVALLRARHLARHLVNPLLRSGRWLLRLLPRL